MSRPGTLRLEAGVSGGGRRVVWEAGAAGLWPCARRVPRPKRRATTEGIGLREPVRASLGGGLCDKSGSWGSDLSPDGGVAWITSQTRRGDPDLSRFHLPPTTIWTKPGSARAVWSKTAAQPYLWFKPRSRQRSGRHWSLTDARNRSERLHPVARSPPLTLRRGTRHEVPGRPVVPYAKTASSRAAIGAVWRRPRCGHRQREAAGGDVVGDRRRPGDGRPGVGRVTVQRWGDA